MDYGPNIEAVTSSWTGSGPASANAIPPPGSTSWRAPHREVKALSETPGVTVTGFVPDVREYLSTAALVVVPWR